MFSPPTTLKPNLSALPLSEIISSMNMEQSTEYTLSHSCFCYRERMVVGVTTTILALALISYGLRLYAKRITTSYIWWDDYVMGIGLALAVIPCICNYIGIFYGLGRHTVTLPPTHTQKYLIVLYAFLIAWITSETSIKIAILLFYWRIFPGKYFRLSIWFIGAFVVGRFIAGFVGLILQCVPVEGNWDPIIHPTCFEKIPFYKALASLGLFSNIVLLVQPLPVIIRLKASSQARLGLCLVFLTGGVVVVVSAFRLASISDIDLSDITYTNVAPTLWTTAEVTIGVVSANLPLMRPVLGKIWSKAEDLHASYRGTVTGTKNRQTLRGQGFAPILQTPGKARSIMGLTSTVHPGERSDAIDLEFGVPLRGIAVRTELECKIEPVRIERDIQEPPHLMIRAGSGEPQGWVDRLDYSSKSESEEAE